jgi:hypothetical protein
MYARDDYHRRNDGKAEQPGVAGKKLPAGCSVILPAHGQVTARGSESQHGDADYQIGEMMEGDKGKDAGQGNLEDKHGHRQKENLNSPQERIW